MGSPFCFWLPLTELVCPIDQSAKFFAVHSRDVSQGKFDLSQNTSTFASI